MIKLKTTDMIKANDLRIGNLFKSAFGRTETVLTIMDNTDNGKIQYKSDHHRSMYSHLIIPKENGNQYKPCEIEGIPLSPDVLEKMCGFEKYMAGEYDNTEMIGYRKGKYDVYCLEDGRFILEYNPSEVALREIEFLHQLQNGWHFLTGQELTINLTSNTTV